MTAIKPSPESLITNHQSQTGINSENANGSSTKRFTQGESLSLENAQSGFIPDPVQDKLVYTSVKGTNDFLIQDVAALYLHPGDRIADVTYGKGVFWKRIDLCNYEFCPSDVKTRPDRPYDFRDLPYPDNHFDVVVFDPPYVHTPGKMIFEKNYRNRETTKNLDHKGIIELYQAGMAEASRVLKSGGLLWVKCQDEIESGKQKWSYIEIHAAAKDLQLYPKDLFILTPDRKPIVQVKAQKHARKNHSYLWIFQKPLRKASENKG